MEQQLFSDLVNLRHTIHREPDLSGDEYNTARTITAYLQKLKPDSIVTGIGGAGLCAVFNGEEEGPSIMYRCELDALPVEEKNSVWYRSSRKGVSHVCGHDGHMAIMVGLAHRLSKKRPYKGKVILLFQPAEETGQGAEWVVNDPKFNDIIPDYVFAYHNLPGYALHDIVLTNGVFASASEGMEALLTGKSSHAAEPEKGNNPAMAVSRIIKELLCLVKDKKSFEAFTLLTIIHARIGSVAYGTSPGEAVVNATLRSYLQSDMDKLKRKAEEVVSTVCRDEHLTLKISFAEKFPSTENHPETTDMIREICNSNGLNVFDLKAPFKWSEDFGHFTRIARGTLIGLGSGINQPALHNPDFDFPDELIPTGVKLYQKIYENILNHSYD